MLYLYYDTRTDPVQYAHCQEFFTHRFDLLPNFSYNIILANILYFTAVKMAYYPTITLCHLDTLHAATAPLPLPQPHDVMWKSIAYVTFKHIV